MFNFRSHGWELLKFVLSYVWIMKYFESILLLIPVKTVIRTKNLLNPSLNLWHSYTQSMLTISMYFKRSWIPLFIYFSEQKQSFSNKYWFPFIYSCTSQSKNKVFQVNVHLNFTTTFDRWSLEFWHILEHMWQSFLESTM